MLQIADAWREADSFWITYRSSRTEGMPRTYLLRNIGVNPIRMAIATVRIALILIRERPDVVISNGAEIAIPAFYLARLLGARTIFVEVWTRVCRPTGTGRLVYPVSNHFLVQWPELLERYGRKARFDGAIL